jgi:hypothetical protein
MIFPKSDIIRNKILFIGGDGFTSVTLPKELNSELIHIPLNQIEQYKIKNIDAALVISQPTVEKICTSKWLTSIASSIPVGIIWYDYTTYYDWVHNMHHCFHIILDDQRVNLPNALSLWTPININFTEPQESRDINVGFYGKIDCDQRKETLKFLLNRGVPVFTTGNSDWNAVDSGMMYHYMQKTKIVLNFSNTRFYPDHTKHQLKGRVLEAIYSGAMILENTNNQSNLYFSDKDIIWWNSHDELLEKLRHYLTNDNERIEVASNAQYLCKTKYTMNNWWKILVPKLLSLRKIMNVKM